MRIIPEEQLEIWRSEDKTGTRRPVARATVQRPYLAHFTYDGGDVVGTESSRLNRKGTYTSILFGNPHPVREIPNIISMEWSRGDQQDVAEATLTLQNSQIVPIGQTSSGDVVDFELSGALSPARGTPGNPWGYAQEGWREAIIEDAIIRTYEGYGCDPTAWPADDANLQPSGTWMVDDVTYGADGTITVKMRDVGRMLLDQLMTYPVVNVADLPLTWNRRHKVKEAALFARGGAWRVPKGRPTSSNRLYVGKGLIEEDGGPFVDRNGAWRGHHPSHALTADATRYWMSTGFRHYNSSSYWEIPFTAKTAIAAVKLRARGGPYRVFISLRGPKGWIGKRRVPVRRKVVRGVNLAGLSIPFVKTQEIARDRWTDVVLPKPQSGITKMRITFLGARDVPLPIRDAYRFESSEWGHHFRRAGLSGIKIYSGSAKRLRVVKGHRMVTKGNYTDWTDIPKWICAWGGLFWPPQATGRDYIQTSPGVRQYTHQQAQDPVLAMGRAWGDFQQSGTGGQSDITADQLDKQPLWESIAQVRDILGFNAYIDETGAFIWRPPNIWKLGQYITPTNLSQRGVGRLNGAQYVHDISEDMLLDYKQTRTSKNLRDRILVASPKGTPGAMVYGYTNNNLRRYSIYTDLNFETQHEVELMADLIAARQLFSSRLGEPVVIPGNPAIQVDDQIRIRERVTSDTYYHRVSQISSTLNMLDGTWTYRMGTHWLGDSATGDLVGDAATTVPNVAQVLANWGVI